MSKEAKFIKDFDFLGFSRCFSLSIEQTSNNHPKMTQFGWILDVFEDCSILAEKQRLKLRKLNSLMNFAFLDTQLDPQVARIVEIYLVLDFVLKFDNSSALYDFLWDPLSNFWSICLLFSGKMWRILQLGIGQNRINPKILQPIMASFWRVFMVK